MTLNLISNESPKEITDLILKEAKYERIYGNFTIYAHFKQYEDFTDLQFCLCSENNEIFMTYSTEQKDIHTTIPSDYSPQY